MKNNFFLVGIFSSLITSQLFGFEVRAHRGGAADRPQNTLPSFKYGIEGNADSLELDIHASKDGVLVVSHDPEIHQDPCREKNGTAIEHPRVIHEMNLSEIENYDCGGIKDADFPNQQLVPGTKIPTLNQVLDLLKRDNPPHSKKVKLAIEIKTTSFMWPDTPGATPTREGIAKSLVDLLEKRKMTNRTSVISFDLAVLKEVKRLSPSQSIQPLIEDVKILEDFADPQKTSLAVDTVLPYWELLTKENVKALHQKGLKVIPWTIDDPELMKKMIDLGVDGVTTDDPRGTIRLKKEIDAQKNDLRFVLKSALLDFKNLNLPQQGPCH